MSQASPTKTDRNTRRRIRRWQRRAQIAAPFLAVPAMLGLLILSVDLIEYRPNAPARPPQKASDVRPRQAESKDEALKVDPQSVSALSVVDASAPLSTGMESGASADAALFEDPMRAVPASTPSMP